MLAMSGTEICEGVMMICFGVSWPVAILKTWRAKRTEGKSLAFLTIIFAGYLAGIVGKFIKSGGGVPEAVTLLYAMNALLVAVDLGLVLYYRRTAGRPEGRTTNGS
jgi:hypothetical protein